MSKGFIYIVASAKNKYNQEFFCNVPTDFGGRLYFGPCKKPMRPKMKVGDFIFGISPANPKPRKIIFETQIDEKISFKEAYGRFPQLRGPDGPIHVRPVNRKNCSFPEKMYEHIAGAMHPNDWKQDLATPDLDAFFVCTEGKKWLGRFGPDIDNEILDFLKGCSVHNKTGMLKEYNHDTTLANPIAYGRLYTGLHLETDKPKKLMNLINDRLALNPPNFDILKAELPRKGLNRRAKKPHSRKCS